MSEYIPYGRQIISEEDIQAVIQVLKSDFLTQGPVVPQFEKEICQYVGAKYGVAVNSATSALHISCLALGVGPGDIVWTSPITFVASANCALYCGASVDFVDIDEDTYNMSVEKLRLKLIHAKKEGRLPKVVIPVHLAGQSCQMREIYNLSKEYGFSIIEDASHAIGGKYLDEPVGNCHYSDITVFSFHPVKIITTAEGGMAMTNNKELNEKMVMLRSHGITRDPAVMNNNDGPWYYEQKILGFNYRMTELQAALGVSQLKNLDLFVENRNKISQLYNESFIDNKLIKTPTVIDDCYSAFHLYQVLVPDDKHLKVFEFLREAGIGVNLHYIPVYHQPYHHNQLYRSSMNNSENFYKRSISLPLFPTIEDRQLNRVVSLINEALAK